MTNVASRPRPSADASEHRSAPEKPWQLQPPDLADIEAAARNLSGRLVRTPLLESGRVDRALGGRLLVKAEGLQRTGSFKARGALNFISLMPEAQRARGVVAFSSGNHAQAVAWAAGQYDAPAVVVMPRTAPRTKVARTREWGAEIIQIDWETSNPREVCDALVAERGMTLVPPFEDRRIIAGAGTLGMELHDQAQERGLVVDDVLIGCSGGGLLAGCAIALHGLSPRTRVRAAEPKGFDDLAVGLAAGHRATNDPGPDSICDALVARTMGDLTFAIARRHVTSSLVVTDDEVLAAMRMAFEEYRIVVEPGGAAALAAVLCGRIDVRGRTVAVVASGSNVDASLFRGALERNEVSLQPAQAAS